MLSNAYLLATFRFDTAENEPAKKLQKVSKYFVNFANEVMGAHPGMGAPPMDPRMAGFAGAELARGKATVT